MTRKYGKGELPTRLRAFILSWTFVNNLTVSFGDCLTWLCFSKIQEDIKGNPIQLTLPDYWYEGGVIAGGFLIILILKNTESRSSLSVIRYFQGLTLVIAITCYKIQTVHWISSYWIIGFYAIFVLQGLTVCMSQVLTVIYILETNFDRDLSCRVILPLLLSCRLPYVLAECMTQLIFIHKRFITLGIGIYCGLFFLALLIFIFLPDSSENGKISEKVDYISYWHLQFKHDTGWLRPLSSSLALSLLCQITGEGDLLFYTWTVQTFPVKAHLFNSIFRLVSTIGSLPIWTSDRVTPVLLLSIGIICVSCFLSGIVFHGVTIISVFSLFPFLLYSSYMISHTVGLYLIAPIIPAILVPRDHRSYIFSINFIVWEVSECIILQTSSALMGYLQTHWFFWMNSGIALIGLLFVIMAISGQVAFRKREIPSRQRTVEEFVTQV